MMVSNEDLDQMKKVLDIMRAYGVSSLEVGTTKIVLGPETRAKTSFNIDDNETLLVETRENLTKLNKEADDDLFWST